MPINGTMAWLQRLKERGVLRVAVSYALIAWLLLQIADVTFEPLGVPRWVMVTLIITAVLGFPVAAALAWFYEAGDQGVERDTAHDGAARPDVSGLRRNADIAIIGVLLATVALLLVRQSDLGQAGAGNSTIAVLPFQNLSSSPSGEVLALGIAESVLHQIANLAELDVISRTSSFAFRDRAGDSREIGRELGARYLLEGSVQSDGSRLRVTTQLIDTETGADVWSMRFDRPSGDIFAVQDEIAIQVTQALELSVDPAAMERMTGQGTRNLNAYLAFLQGRALLANNRVVDANEAIGYFERAVKFDPGFATGYVSMAEAGLFVGEYEVSGNRQARFAEAWRQGQQLVAKALELDPHNGHAFLQRAHLNAFLDLPAAEKDYRRGLELSPNSAKGHAGLAAVVYETPARRDEALELLDRARKLDPLEPAYDVTKAQLLYMERADFAGANSLLLDVVKRNPRYQPAFARLGDVHGLTGQPAKSIRYNERALALDPSLEMARRNLIGSYIDLGDMVAARQLVEDDEFGAMPRQMLVFLREGSWQEAGEVAYASLAAGTVSSTIETAMNVAAIRMHARTTGDFTRAQAALEDASGVRWDEAGRAILAQDGSPLRDAAIGLADMLLEGGQPERGHALLAEILGNMKREVDESGQPEFFYYRSHPIALMLQGDREAAIQMLERSVASGLALRDWWFFFESEPAYASLHTDARFQATLQKVRDRIAAQRSELDRLRTSGQVPTRT
jgi:TolB-like protein/tetratricopeptide (TPR) repeat protein